MSGARSFLPPANAKSAEPVAWYWIPSLRRVAKVPVRIGQEKGWRLAECQDLDDDQVEPQAAEDCGCGGSGLPLVPLVLWAGCVWYGLPWPRRLRWRWAWPPLVVIELGGCGCIKLWKDGARELRAFRRRHRIEIDPLLRWKASRRWSRSMKTASSADGGPADGSPTTRRAPAERDRGAGREAESGA